MFKYYKCILMTAFVVLYGFSTTAQFKMEKLGTFTAEADFAEGGTEIIAYDETGKKVFSTNGFQNRIDIIDVNDPTKPVFVKSFDVSAIGDGIQSVAVHSGIVAVAISNEDGTKNGFVGFFDTDGNFKSFVEVGVLPDAVTFSSDGKTVISSNEGEPSDDYLQDPKGSISIIDVSGGIDGISQANVVTLGFEDYNNNYNRNIRVFGRTENFASDFEDSTLEASGVHAFSNASNRDWRLSSRSGISYAEMNGFGGDVASDDWLVIDSLNLSASGHEHAYLSFLNERRYNGNGMEVLASTDFAGDVKSATWTNIEDNKSMSLRITSASDDTEEYVAGPNQTKTVGEQDFGSLDLEFNSEKEGMTRPQVVAIRFDNVQIQPGAKVKNAFVQFEVDEAAKDTGKCSVDIMVEDSENASTFVGTNSEVENRTKVANRATDLFISEYAEGSSSNKYIEIYNGTGSDVDLSQYTIKGTNNGTLWGDNGDRDFSLSGTLSNGSVYIICADQADTTILAKADTALSYESPLHHNGDDAIAIFKGTEIIDAVGVDGNDPGSGWEVAGVSNATKDHTLRRKASSGPNMGNWSKSAGTSIENSEWIVEDKDVWTYLGQHTIDSLLSVRWTIAANTWQTVGEAGADQQTVDISKLIQSVVDMPGWKAGNAIALYFAPAGIDEGIRVAKSADGAPNEAAELHVAFDGGVINWSDNGQWNWVESGLIDISEHISDNTAIAFHYTGGNNKGDGVGSLYRITELEIAQQDLANDLEPEYSVVGSDNNTVYTVAQENNAMIVSTINPPAIYGIYPLGTKDHSAPGNGLDPTNDDGGINISNFPLNGMFMPDGMAVANIGGSDYVFTANEGDAREYEGNPGLIEEVDLLDGGQGLVGQGYMDMDNNDTADDGTEDWYTQWGGDDKLNDMSYPLAFNVHSNGVIGDLNLYGDTDGDGLIEELHSYGARSFTIWDNRLNIVFDSKDEFEQTIAKEQPDNFGNDNDEQDFEGRSDNKGPEPESVAVGQLGDKYFAFIGLERAGGIMVYDVTDPANSKYVMYELNRDVTKAIEEQGDLGPEDVKFIPAEQSPNGKAMVMVSNEVSNTITLYNVEFETGNIQEIANEDLVKISPNPSNGDLKLYVNGAISDNYNIEVYNLVGNIVYSKKGLHGGVASLDLTQLGKGVYIISVGNEKVSSRQRVVLK